MDVIRFGLGIRALLLRRRLTQQQLARRVGLSQSAVSRIERGGADRLTVSTLVRVAAAVEARLDVRLLWQGEGLDRLLDQRHADLVERVVALLTGLGWDVIAEVSFNVRGERGSIDVLGFHRPSGSLIVIEVKSVVPDIQATLSGLDRKARLAPIVASERGWRPSVVGRVLVLAEDRTARRRLDAHGATFRSTLPARTIEVRCWLREPLGAIGGVLFLPAMRYPGTRHRVAATRVVHSRSARTTASGGGK